MNTTSIGDFIKSKNFIVLIVAVAVSAVAAGSFSMGMAVGFHKARNSYAWGENYHRTFAGPRGGFVKGFVRDFDGREFIESNGVFGTVIKVDAQSLVISGRDGREQVVAVSPGTVIRKFKDEVPLSGVTLHDTVVVVGAPDQSGTLQAELIRIMPMSPTSPGGPMPSEFIQSR